VGVGGATARKLTDLGIHTADALRDMPMKQARAVGTVVLERLVAELRGVPPNAVESVEPRRKGMAVTRSFGTPICDFKQMMGALSQYALRAGEKLRSHGLVAARLTAFFHTNKHKPRPASVWHITHGDAAPDDQRQPRADRGGEARR
jgi:nucleotidyltransferase/DNA polymerase involved in DNA repair